VGAVDAVGVVVEAAADEVGVAEAGVLVELADGARTSDKVKFTGNGHPPSEDDEPALDEVDEPELVAPAVLFDVDASATDPTPCTRPSATIVEATADWLAAQPVI
jgi:hypothetical protein